jgi:hypothetical protein
LPCPHFSLRPPYFQEAITNTNDGGWANLSYAMSRNQNESESVANANAVDAKDVGKMRHCPFCHDGIRRPDKPILFSAM